ncbi:hypothetical protein [Caldicellulosiruptor acetigenus]|uniref:hypothetical protein n=1 Tax=Caldicellulosiruptor acetigenus TaxID=301953 RepID=UPI001E32E8D8|nr:hypothetical protein [Caldicellulosiruptor acetigenus]WAM36673.1 hypothetical protein OTK01_000453 [Caldicellulosiruptor acetigenus]
MYYIRSYENYFSKKPSVEEVIKGVKEIKKNKFSEDAIREKYDYIVKKLID